MNLLSVQKTQEKHEAAIHRLDEAVQLGKDSDSKSIVNEIESRLARQTSIVVRGLPENTSGNLVENHMEDKKNFQEICSILNVPEPTTYELKRVGTIAAKRPRLLKVKFDRKTDRDEILSRSKMLRTSKFKDIYVNRDLTVLQQKERQALIRELKQRREQNEDVVIRHDKVILRKDAYIPQNFRQRF